MKIRPIAKCGNRGTQPVTATPSVTSAVWQKEHKTLIVCFIDRTVKLFKVLGLQESGLDVRQQEKCYRSSFIVKSIAIGQHQITQEDIAILTGENKMIQIFINPTYAKYLQTVTMSETGGKDCFITPATKKIVDPNGLI